MQIAARAWSFIGGVLGRGQSAPAPTLNREPAILLPGPHSRPSEWTPECNRSPTPELTPAAPAMVKSVGEPLLVLPIRLHAPILLASLGDLSHITELDLDDDTPIDLDNPPITRGPIERGIFSDHLREHYKSLCGPYGLLCLKEERWNYANGVAEHVRASTDPGKARYRYTVRDGREQRLVFFRLRGKLPSMPQEALTHVRRVRGVALQAPNVLPFVDERRAA